MISVLAIYTSWEKGNRRLKIDSQTVYVIMMSYTAKSAYSGVPGANLAGSLAGISDTI